MESLDRRFYPDPIDRDPIARFRAVLAQHAAPDAVVLDIGAGAGRNDYGLRGTVARVVGTDPDESVLTNPLLDEAHVGDLRDLDLPSSSFDLALSIYVLEHVAEPDAFVEQVHRVLKPGGLFVALTPNRWHYVAAASALTPQRFHEWLNERRGRPREATFPTWYRMNTRAALRKQFEDAGFETVSLDTFECRPNYLTFSLPTFVAGIGYERAVNATDRLADLRVNIIAIFRKRA